MNLSLIVPLVLLVIFIAVAAVLSREGLWSSMVMLLNVLLAASMATAWYEPLARLIESKAPSFQYLIDFLLLWGLFAVLLLAMRLTTDTISHTKVKFVKPLETVGGPVVAIMTAWVTVMFAAATLHTLPVAQDTIQKEPEENLFFGFAPDRAWLAWVQGSSRNGPFARPINPFEDPQDFINRYAFRRKAFESAPNLRVDTPAPSGPVEKIPEVDPNVPVEQVPPAEPAPAAP